MTENRIPLLIDTDPGVDDALALLMAFNDPRHDVVGLTIAAGNVGLDHTVANALKICEVAGVEVPVFAGCAAPLLHPAVDAAYVHGQDGLGDVGHAPSSRKAETEHAALAILRLSHQYAGKLLLVALGPLTNLAVALTLDPSLPSRIGRLVVMGGAVTGHGNMTAHGEFNIAFDPEAAHIVLSAFPQFDLVDWEATISHGLPHGEVLQWLAVDSARAKFFDEISRKTREWSVDRRGDDWFAADALAMAHALEPDGAVEIAQRALVVETEGRHARGATIVDWRIEQADDGGNASILLRYDRQRFQRRVEAALAAK